MWKQTHVPNLFLQKLFENQLKVLLIKNVDKSHYVYTKDFNRFMYNRKSHKDKKMHFGIIYLQRLISEEILANQKRFRLKLVVKKALMYQYININISRVAMYNLVTIIISCKILLWFMQTLYIVQSKIQIW